MNLSQAVTCHRWFIEDVQEANLEYQKYRRSRGTADRRLPDTPLLVPRDL